MTDENIEPDDESVEAWEDNIFGARIGLEPFEGLVDEKQFKAVLMATANCLLDMGIAVTPLLNENGIKVIINLKFFHHDSLNRRNVLERGFKEVFQIEFPMEALDADDDFLDLDIILEDENKSTDPIEKLIEAVLLNKILADEMGDFSNPDEN